MNGEKKGKKNIRLIIKPSRGGRDKKPVPFWGNILTTLLIFLTLLSLYTLLSEGFTEIERIPISQLAQDIEAGQVTSIVVEGDILSVIYITDEEKEVKKEDGTALSETLTNYGVSSEQLKNVSISVESDTGFAFWFLTLAPILFPIALLLLFIWFMGRQVRGAGMQAFSFGQSKARLISPDDKRQRVMFKDVAGAREAKEELAEIVDFLKNPKKFFDIGAQIPRGIILMGAPGTGKTLLARAVAGEAGVAFFSISGSEFVEMFVGVGASRVRDLFKVAKHTAPAIVFIDEIDAVGRVRGTGVGGGNDEREQTLNQILVEMDGFEQNEKVIVMAASVTGDTPVLIRRNGIHELKSISQVIDPFYKEGEEGIEKEIPNLETLGFERKKTNRVFQKPFFGVSAYKKVRSVFRHRVNEVYEISYPGGRLRTTGNHSVFVRTCQGLVAKPVSLLKVGEELVNLPYIANRTTAREIRAHAFSSSWSLALPVYQPLFSPFANLASSYAYARQEKELSQADIGEIIGYSQTTVSKWQHTERLPRALSKAYFTHILPEKVSVTPELMRLFGYYAAEGYARKEVDFCFNVREKKEVSDVKYLMKNIFGLVPDRERNITKNAVNIIYYSKPLAEFFIEHCGKGAHNKHIPEFLFNAPKKYFLQFLKGYAAGDGHTDKRGRLEITSVSKQILSELLWLSKMHGHNAYISSFTVAPRRIKGGKFLSETKAWRLGFGKTQNPINPVSGKESILRPKIKSIKKVPYSGYVYDLCGCDNEAFFGGVSPILLHNTNRPDVLDPALLRPGRFDRRVTIDLPDRKDREEILKIHSGKKPLAEDVNFSIVAERTPGFSGADLQALMNEAAILAARENRKKVSQFDLVRSIEKVMLGPERRSHILSIKEKEITAYHEAGHAIIASVLPYADPVHKISIISRGRAAGYTLKLPFEDKRFQSKKEFLDDIAVSLGGYVAEKMIFGDLTTGSSNDLQVSSALARDMVTKYGMSDTIGPIALESQVGRTLFGRGVDEKDYSEEVGARIDKEVERIMNEALKKAEDVLNKHKDALSVVAKELIAVETIERDSFEKILIANGITPKKKESNPLT